MNTSDSEDQVRSLSGGACTKLLTEGFEEYVCPSLKPDLLIAQEELVKPSTCVWILIPLYCSTVCSSVG